MEDTIATLYVVNNNVNDKRYFGIIWKEGKTVEDRFAEHCSGNGGKLLFEAMQDIGSENFWISEIKRGPLSYIRELEIRMIRRYSHTTDGKGYNGCLAKAIVMSEAGRASMIRKLKDNKDIYWTDERRHNSSEAQKRIRKENPAIVETWTEFMSEWWSNHENKNYHSARVKESLSRPEVKQKMSIANVGENNGFYGKTHSEDVKQKLRECRIAEADIRGRKEKVIKRPKSAGENNPMYGKVGRITGSKNPNATSIVVDGVEYETMKAASEATGLSLYKLRRYFKDKTRNVDK